jgi:hypothetical protein
MKYWAERLAAVLIATPLPALAEIGRVYHPYVTPLETEIEWRSIVADDNDAPSDGEQMHRLAIGKSLSEKLFAEAYLIGRKTDAQDLKVSGFELEGLYQLTEPGEHLADLAVLVEFERDTDRNISYVGGGLVAEKELGITSLALNLIGEYEYGGGVKDEFDTEVTAQWRWRWRERFEPAVEYYVDEYTEGVGPVLTGLERLGQRQKLKWEFGVIFGTGNDAPEQTWRALLEFEF